MYDEHNKTMLIFYAQWNLVCGNAFIMEIVQPIYLVGAILGAFMQGPLSDRYVYMNNKSISLKLHFYICQ